jgi:hypothetical protein
VPSKDPLQFLTTSVQKSYFMLSRSARAVLDTALEKCRQGRTDLISVGGITQLKPALRRFVRSNSRNGPREDRLRQPVFLGMREDKNPGGVIREKAN